MMSLREERKEVVALGLEDAYKRVQYAIFMRTPRNIKFPSELIFIFGEAMLKGKVPL